MHFRLEINNKYFFRRFYVTHKHSAASGGDEKLGKRFSGVYDNTLGDQRGPEVLPIGSSASLTEHNLKF